MKQSTKTLMRRMAPWIATATLGLLLAPPGAAARRAQELQPATLARSVTAVAPGLGQSLELDSVGSFDADGGMAVIEPGTPREEVVSYSATDAAASALVGIARGPRAIAHRQGSPIVPREHAPATSDRRPPTHGGDTSREDHSHDHDHHEGDVARAHPRPPDPWGLNKPEPDPDQAWLNLHCKAESWDTTAPNVITPLFVYDAYSGSSTVNWEKKMRDEIYAIDRAIEESHQTYHQHLRFACTKNAKGEWVNVWTPSHPADSHDGSDPDCGTVPSRIRPYYGQGNRRYIYFFDWSLDRPGGNDCSGGRIDYSDTQPGITNKANRDFGYSTVDPDWWTVDGTSNVSASVTLQELLHSWGLVQAGPGWDGELPEAQRTGAGIHSWDYPDVMGFTYYYPPSVRLSCEGDWVYYNLTHVNTYLDCGYDTYWNPNPAPGSYLCKNFNLATDSLYLEPRPARNC